MAKAETGIKSEGKNIEVIDKIAFFSLIEEWKNK